MKIKFLLYYAFFFFSSYLSFANPDTSKVKDTSTAKKINQQIAQDDKKYAPNMPTQNMPWIVALTIGVMTVIVNIMVSKAASNNVNKQIKSSTDIALNEIKTTKEITLTEFKATLNSKNRQEWINEVRHCLSEYITQSRMLNIECQNDNPSSEKIDTYFSKIGYNYYKILLLLKHNKPEHQPLYTAINELSGLLDIHIINTRHSVKQYDNKSVLDKQNEIIKLGMELFYFEWNKIQKMENQ